MKPESLCSCIEPCYEFFLWNVDIGLADLFTQSEGVPGGKFLVRDAIKFEISGQSWLLRRPVGFKGELIPADTAYHRAALSGESTKPKAKIKHAILQVSADGMNVDDASEIADEISCILSLCFGQYVVWHQVGLRKEHDYQMLKGRSVSGAIKASTRPPIGNDGDGRLRKFIEMAFPVFTAEKLWWRYTIRWFCIASEIKVVEVSGMIFSMLLERISKWVLNSVPRDFPPQIGDDLAAALKNKSERANLVSAFTAVMLPHAKEWTDDRSRSLLGEIVKWNSTMPYHKQVIAACAHLNIKPPSTLVTRTRNPLLHNGMLTPELIEDHKKITNYDNEVHQAVQIMILAILGYTGPTFVPGKRECSMKEFLVDSKA